MQYTQPLVGPSTEAGKAPQYVIDFMARLDAIEERMARGGYGFPPLAREPPVTPAALDASSEVMQRAAKTQSEPHPGGPVQQGKRRIKKRCTTRTREEPSKRLFAGRCYTCGKEGHKSKDCWQTGSSASRFSRDSYSATAPKGNRPFTAMGQGVPHFGGHDQQPRARTCFTCGQPGHLRKDCTAPQRGGGPAGQGYGHQQGRGPQQQFPQQGQQQYSQQYPQQQGEWTRTTTPPVVPHFEGQEHAQFVEPLDVIPLQLIYPDGSVVAGSEARSYHCP